MFVLLAAVQNEKHCFRYPAIILASCGMSHFNVVLNFGPPSFVYYAHGGWWMALFFQLLFQLQNKTIQNPASKTGEKSNKIQNTAKQNKNRTQPQTLDKHVQERKTKHIKRVKRRQTKKKVR